MALSGSETPAFDSENLRELKQKVVDGCHILDREGITDGFGHVSIRVPGPEASVTPTPDGARFSAFCAAACRRFTCTQSFCLPADHRSIQQLDSSVPSSA